MWTRREVLVAGVGAGLLGRWSLPGDTKGTSRALAATAAAAEGFPRLSTPAAASPAPAVIGMRSDRTGSPVWFDPIGLRIETGHTVRWVVASNVHTSPAYHPANDRHSLRIPEGAPPWASGCLVNPGDRFEVTLVVGRPGGPGAPTFDPLEARPGPKGGSRSRSRRAARSRAWPRS